MKTQPEGPVFLVGCPRSGTTLLQRMLDAHPAVAIAPETHFIRRFWLRRSFFGDLNRDDNFARLVGEIVAMPEFAEMGLSGNAFREAVEGVARDYGALFGLLLEMFARSRGARIAGEKTPNHLLYMPTIERFFPEARFIHLVRDPRAVVNSWRDVPWSTGHVVGDAFVWRRYMATARQNPPGDPNRLLVVRYENLIETTGKTLDGVCDFLAIQRRPELANYHEHGADTVNVEREPWKARVIQPLDAQRSERWRHELAHGDVARIEVVCGSDMRELGYTEACSRPAIWALTLPVWCREGTRRLTRFMARRRT